MRIGKLLLVLGGLILACGACGLLLLTYRPELGAWAASPLRRAVGNESVAFLESAAFRIHDGVQQLGYRLGLAKAESPWQIATATPRPTLAFQATLPTLTSSPQATRPTHTQDLALFTPTPAPSATATALPAITLAPPATSEPTQVPEWTLPPLEPLGDLDGEGEWQPYLRNQQAEVVGLRTFLQPDPERPYAVVAVVAFRLDRANLHYVLGSEEPALPGGPRGFGYLPQEHQQPGLLLAAFNGGFMATHGEYGAMANGLQPLPPRPGFATVTLDSRGNIQIGEWGSDIDPAGIYTAWRQNARMVIHHGQVGERVGNDSINTWGGSINGDIITWRSGIGLDAAADVLYYFAGPSLSMPSLAQAMQAAGVYNGMLLDINPTWVHFTVFRPEGLGMRPVPLLPEGMDTEVDRYLRQSARDFFYVIASDS